MIIQLSVNDNITLQMSKQDAGKITKGWEVKNINWELDELTYLVRNKAIVMSELIDGHRLKRNVKRVFGLALDFDAGVPTVEQFIEMNRNAKFTYFLYTTTSHTPEKHKFRVLIPFDPAHLIVNNPPNETIDDIEKLKLIFTQKFPTIDSTCFSSERYFYPSKEAKVYLHKPDPLVFLDYRNLLITKSNNSFLDESYDQSLNNLKQQLEKIEEEIKSIKAESENTSNVDRSVELEMKLKLKTAERDLLNTKIKDLQLFESKSKNKKENENLYISESDYLKSAEIDPATGKHVIIKISDIPFSDNPSSQIKKQVFCPFCDPKTRKHPNSPNAFVSRNKYGMPFLYCSSEDKTYWPDIRSAENLTGYTNKLIWSENNGLPVRIDIDNPNNPTGYHVFKNNKDWNNFCLQNNINPKIESSLPRKWIEFDISAPPGVYEDKFNLFQETKYLKQYRDYCLVYYPELKTHIMKVPNEEKKEIDFAETLRDKCPNIFIVINNLFGEDYIINYFMNWLATMLQTRKKSTTAWIITTRQQGAGKDLLFTRILAPIFGKDQCQLLGSSSIADKFNALDARCWLRGYNELIKSENKIEARKVKEWLKNLITATRHKIEPKGVDSFFLPNFMNFILFSNSNKPIEIDNNDRRFNIIRNPNSRPLREFPQFSSYAKIEPLIEAELDNFAEMLFTAKHNIDKYNTALSNDVKERVARYSMDPYEEFANLLDNGEFFTMVLEEAFPSSQIVMSYVDQSRLQYAQQVQQMSTSNNSPDGKEIIMDTNTNSPLPPQPKDSPFANDPNVSSLIINDQVIEMSKNPILYKYTKAQIDEYNAYIKDPAISLEAKRCAFNIFVYHGISSKQLRALSSVWFPKSVPMRIITHNLFLQGIDNKKIVWCPIHRASLRLYRRTHD